MSAKSRCRNHNKNHNKNHIRNRRASSSSINAVINEINVLAQQLSPASPFETAQLQNLQSMIESLATQVLFAMKQKDDSNPNAALPLLRVYAQYLNLYMKLKDKCFKQHSVKSIPPSETFLTAPLLQPVTEPFQPVTDKQSMQIHESIQRVTHKNESKPSQPVNQLNGWLMPDKQEEQKSPRLAARAYKHQQYEHQQCEC